MIDTTVSRSVEPEGFYKDECTSSYELHEGILVLPVMGAAGTPPISARVHAAYTTRHSAFEYVRAKTPSVIPAPGDTLSGHKYLGGAIRVAAPKQDGQGSLIFASKGHYDYVLPVDIRSSGLIYFDSHGYNSNIEFLGIVPLNQTRDSAGNFVNDTWNSPYFDLNVLASAKILI